jgi:PEP-CTERM motif
MKRAMGLILAVLVFAVVAHADGIQYHGWEYAAGADLRSDALFTGALHSSNVLIEPGRLVFSAGRTLAEFGDAERLSDYVFYSHFGVLKEALEGPVELDSLRRRLDSLRGDRYEGPSDNLRIEHADPFRRTLGVQEVPEPGVLLLMGGGLAALALWKRLTMPSASR